MAIAATMRNQFCTPRYQVAREDLLTRESSKASVLPEPAPIHDTVDYQTELHPEFSPLLKLQRKGESSFENGESADLLHDQHIQRLFQSSAFNALSSGRERFISANRCTCIIALMCIAIECKCLSPRLITGFLTECAALYNALLSRLSSLMFARGINVEEFCASLVACGLYMRNNEESIGGTTPQVMKGVALSGFGFQVVDRAMLHCIPDDVVSCVDDPIAKGTLRGLCFTRSLRIVYWGPDLVDRIESLADGFAESPRKEQSFKLVLMLLLEAMSCSYTVSLERTSKWIAAIIQESYIISGLLQKDPMHSRVAASTLTLLMRHYQESASRYLNSPNAKQLQRAAPDFSEGDELIDTVWRALFSARSLVQSSSRVPTLYGSNVLIVMKHLLTLELERLRCCHALYSNCRKHSSSFPDEGEKLLESFRETQYASVEEETMRVRAIAHIARFITSSNSVFGMIPASEVGDALRNSISDMLSCTMTALTESSICPGATGARNSFGPTQRNLFSNQYYRNLEGIANLVIDFMLQDSPQETTISTVNVDACIAGCLVGMCFSDAHLRAFVFAVLTDYAARVCTSLDTIMKQGDQKRVPSEKVSVAFDVLCCILIPKCTFDSLHQTNLISVCNVKDQIACCSQLLCNTYTNALRATPTLKELVDRESLPIPAVKVSAVFWDMACRVHKRLSEIVRYSESMEETKEAELLEEIQATINVAKVLLNDCLSCILDVAWPRTGVLYQKECAKDKASMGILLTAAARCISPFLGGVNVLVHLIPWGTQFTLAEVSSRVDSCRKLFVSGALDDKKEESICYFSYGCEIATTCDPCGALFRSCWLLLTFYEMTTDVVSLTSPRLEKNASRTKFRSGLTKKDVRQIALWGAVLRPLLLMRSATLQQVDADVQVLVKHLDVVSGLSSDSKKKKMLKADVVKLCRDSSKYIDKLSVSELFVMKSLLHLDLVRAATGSIACSSLYHHFDVREFVASSAIPKVIKCVTDYACEQFIAAAIKCSDPGISFQLVRHNIRQLLLYATFAVRSVRANALYTLRRVLNALPMQTIQSGGLSLLWRLIDLVDSGDQEGIEAFRVKCQYPDTVNIATECTSAERVIELEELQKLSQEWIEIGKSRAPVELFHTTLHFLTSSYAEGSVYKMPSGTKLAIIAGQIEDGSSEAAHRISPSVIMKFSRAKGAVVSALVFSTPKVVEGHVISSLGSMIRAGMESESTRTSNPAARETFFTKLESELYAMTVMMTIPLYRKESRSTTMLLHLVQGPIMLYNAKVLKIATECWSWMISSYRALMVPVLENIVQAIQWTKAKKLGLFDREKSKHYEIVENGSQMPEQKCGEKTPHHILFQFISETYLRHHSDMSQNSSVLSLLYLLATCIVEQPQFLSLKDQSFAETMHGMLLVGNIVHQLFISNIRELRANCQPTIPFTTLSSLRQKWYMCILHWFRKTPPTWYFAADPSNSQLVKPTLVSLIDLLTVEQKTLRMNNVGFLDFSTNTAPGSVFGHLASIRHRDLVQPNLTAEKMAKICAQEQKRLDHLLQLLLLLLNHELLRIQVWQEPRRTKKIDNPMHGFKATCEACLDSATIHDPMVAVAMIPRLSTCFPTLTKRMSFHIVTRPERFAHIPEAIDYYLTSRVVEKDAPHLLLFANAGIIQSLRLLDERYSTKESVTSFAIASLLSKNSESLIFYLPQLLQVLGSNGSGKISSFLEQMAKNSIMFCHQLLWSLRTEGEGEEHLAKKCKKLEAKILHRLSNDEKTFYTEEFNYIDSVIALSGELMQYTKPERKPKLRVRLRDEMFHQPPTVNHLYLPTNPSFRVTDVIAHTASAMQSAAKCPIFVQFEGVEREHEDTTLPVSGDETTAVRLKKACIFKMGDDCRQDQIALQLIEIFRRIFQTIEVPFFLYPYRVVTTGQTSGIIECVPNSLSRNEIGKLVESNLAEYFVQCFGHPETSQFRNARENFVRSAAAYSVVTFVLNIKDRHNGNIMIDSSGNLIHIDFGFLFDTSPGGDMNFESSPFKLTTEMIQLIGRDVGSSSTLASPPLQKALIDEENYVYFKTLANRCYLAVRQYAREICVLVELMLHSGLPCFKPQQTIANLAKRLCMNKEEVAAADFMRQRIHESKQNLRTKLYDHFQRIAEGIEM